MSRAELLSSRVERVSDYVVVGAARYSGAAGRYIFRSHANNEVKVSTVPLKASRCARGGDDSRRILRKIKEFSS